MKENADSINHRITTTLFFRPYFPDMSEQSSCRIHVVMLPWLAFGHMIPFLDLSIALAKSGIHVSYFSTPRNIQRLPQNLSPLIQFIAIPLPNIPLLDQNAEATTDIKEDQIELLKMAYDLLQKPIRNFIADMRPTPGWIIVDFFQHWAVDISQEFDIPIFFCELFSASSTLFFWTPEYLSGEKQWQARSTPEALTSPPDWVDFPSPVAYRGHEAVGIHKELYTADATGLTAGERICKLVQGSRAIAVRSSMEFEGDYIKLYSKVTGKQVFPLGFLPPEKLLGRRRIMHEEPWCKIFDWLDQQQARSVVFVGFGSECKLNKDQVQEIAYGLELSGLTFLWTLRKPDWASSDAEALPPGFTPGRGLVQIGWAPQKEILAHSSIGGSLFHAGWASIVETIVYGHCLVVLPFVIAQPLDSRLLVEKGLAIEVERNEDGSFTRHGIADSLRKAMDSEEGNAMRARTKEAAEGMIGNQELNDNYIKKFVEFLNSGTQELV